MFFLDDEAVKFLDEDLKSGKHKRDKSDFIGLWNDRSQYKAYPYKYFAKCVKQRIHSLRHVNHLEAKRAKKHGLDDPELIAY